MTYVINCEESTMFLKKRKSLLCIFAAFFAAVLLCVGAALLSTESQKAYAAGLKSKIYWEINGTTLTISGDVSDSDFSGSPNWFYDDATFGNTDIPWRDGKSTVGRAVIKNGVAPVSTANWFYEFGHLDSIDLAGLDTSKTTNMNSMFNHCGLGELDLSRFKTSNVTDMSHMFGSCISLTELDLSGFDTSNVTDMSGMFNACQRLSYVDLSNFDMTNCTYKSMIFSGCDALKKAKLSASFAASGAIFNADAKKWCLADGVLYHSDSDPKMSAAGTYYAEGNYQVGVSHGGESEGYYGIAKAWAAANNAGSATVTLRADAEAEATLVVGTNADISLDLNGCKLEHTGDVGSVIEVRGKFHLKDIDTEHKIHKYNNVDGKWVFSDGGINELTGGVITGGRGQAAITANETEGGGGVYICGGGEFNMGGGTIAGNSATSYGGGVYLDNRTRVATFAHSTFNMTKGAISGNVAEYGGGVYMGGTYNPEHNVFNMSGGEISDNTAEYCGGIFAPQRSDVYMSGTAEVKYNKADFTSGGVHVQGGKFYVSGAAAVVGNTVAAVANNVYLADDSDKIRVNGALTQGAQIGVTLSYSHTNKCCTQDYGKANPDDKPAKFFTSDDVSKLVASDGGEVLISKPVAAVEGTEYGSVSEAWAAANDAGTATVTLLSDAEIVETLTVAGRKNITLDLNGYMLKLKLAEGAKGSVIEVDGTFTLTDGYEGTDRKHEVTNVVSEEFGDYVMITGGVITGGNTQRGGGVFVDVVGKFTMNGGTIAGNSADICGGVYVEGGTFRMVKGVISYNLTTGGGGGAFVTYGGEFIMGGGTISGNGAYTGGGVYVNCGVESAGDSKFTMNGGTISGNSANTGGGVWNNGSLTVADNAKIIENSGSNVYLSSGKKITVAGALSSGAQIGVTLSKGYTGAFTQGYGENNKDGEKVVSPNAYIISDDATLPCIYADKNGEVCVGAHTGGTATCVAKAVCVYCKEAYGAVDSTKHNPDDDDGDCSTAITCKDCGTVVTAAKSHSYADGYSSDEAEHWHICQNSGCTKTDTKTAHTAGEWIVDTPAQIGAVGSKHKECTVCGYTLETAEIPAIEPDHEHTFATEWTKDETGHWHAATCEHISQKSGFAAHTAGEWIVDTPAQIGAAGSKHKECTVCGYTVQTEVIPALVDTLVKPDDNGGENKVVVTTPEGFPADIELVVTEIAKENYGAYDTIAQTVNGEIRLVYDVTLKSNGVTVQPDGTLTIKLLIPTQLQGKNFKLFHLHGSQATDMNYNVDGNYAVVTCDNLSEFIFVGEKTAAPVTPDTPTDTDKKEKSYVWICWLFIPLAFAGGSVALGIWLYRKKNNK